MMPLRATHKALILFCGIIFTQTGLSRADYAHLLHRLQQGTLRLERPLRGRRRGDWAYTVRNGRAFRERVRWARRRNGR